MGSVSPTPARPVLTAPVPGAELLGALPLAALAVMAINDHLLRPQWPGWITGKLSDLAVVIFFPFLITATLGWLAWLANHLSRRLRLGRAERPTHLTVSRLWFGLAVTGLALAAINLSTTARDLYVALLTGLDLFTWLGPFRYTSDPSDCFALLALPVAYAWGRSRIRRAAAARCRLPP